MPRQQPHLADVTYFEGPDAPDLVCSDTVLLSDVGGLSSGAAEPVTLTLAIGGTADTDTGALGILTARVAFLENAAALISNLFIQGGAVVVTESLLAADTEAQTVPAATITVTADRIAGVVGYVLGAGDATPLNRDITVRRVATTLIIDLPEFTYPAGTAGDNFFSIFLVTAVSGGREGSL